jgi:hypothetical protein
LLLKPEKVLYKLVREKKKINANVIDVCFSEEAIYFAC